MGGNGHRVNCVPTSGEYPTKIVQLFRAIILQSVDVTQKYETPHFHQLKKERFSQ